MMPQIIATPIPIGNANWKLPSKGANIQRGISKRIKPVNLLVPDVISCNSIIAQIPTPSPQVPKKVPIPFVNEDVLERKETIIPSIPPITAEKNEIIIPRSPSGIKCVRSFQLCGIKEIATTPIIPNIATPRHPAPESSELLFPPATPGIGTLIWGTS